MGLVPRWSGLMACINWKRAMYVVKYLLSGYLIYGGYNFRCFIYYWVVEVSTDILLYSECASSNTFSISLLMLHVHQLARYAVRQLCDISFSLRSISYLIREICWLKINQFPCQVIKKLMKGLTIDDTDNWGDLVCHKRAVVLITHNFHFLLSKEYSIWMRLLHSSEQK